MGLKAIGKKYLCKAITHLKRLGPGVPPDLATFETKVRKALQLKDPKIAVSLFQKAFDLTGIHNPQHDNILRIGRESLEAFLKANPAEKLKFYERFKRSGFGYTYEARFVNISALLLNLLKGNPSFNFSEAKNGSGPRQKWFEDEWIQHSQPFPLPRIDKILQRLEKGSISLCDIGSSCKRDGSPTVNILKHILSSAIGRERLEFHGIDQVRDEYWDIKTKRFVPNHAYQQVSPSTHTNNGIRYHDYTIDNNWDLTKSPLPKSFDIITCSMVFPPLGKPREAMPTSYHQQLIWKFSKDKHALFKRDKTELPPISNQNGKTENLYVAGKEGLFLKNMLLSLKDGGILIIKPFTFKNETDHRDNVDLYWIMERRGDQFVIWDLTIPYQNDPKCKPGNADVIRIAKEIQSESFNNSYVMIEEKDHATLIRISQKLHFLKYLNVPHQKRGENSQYRDFTKALLLVLTEKRKDGDITPLLCLLLKEFIHPEKINRIYSQKGLPGIEEAVDQILESKGFGGFEEVIFSEV